MAHIYIKGKQDGATVYEDGQGNNWQHGLRLRKENAYMCWDDVRGPCISNGLYTKGDSKAYAMLQQLIEHWDGLGWILNTEMLQIVAEDILDHSDTDYSLEELMYELQFKCVRRFYTV